MIVHVFCSVLTVAATNITALGFFGIGKRVTSVRESTFLILSITSSGVKHTFCKARSSLSASHAVAYLSTPSQNATTAECGDRNGRVATGLGYKDPTMAACTPPRRKHSESIRNVLLHPPPPPLLLQIFTKNKKKKTPFILLTHADSTNTQFSEPCFRV